MRLQILLQKKTKDACIKNTWLKIDFDMIRKFPCYCNLCEHESRACAQSKEAPMEKNMAQNGL